MALILKPERWHQQPFRPRAIDWGNGLTRNLVIGFCGSSLDAFGPVALSGSGWRGWAAGNGSKRIAHPTTGDLGRNINGQALALSGSSDYHIGTKAWSVWARVAPGSSTTGYLISQADGTSSNRTGIWMSTYWQVFKGGIAGSSANQVVDTGWQDVCFTMSSGTSPTSLYYKNTTGASPCWVLSGAMTGTLTAPWLIGARWNVANSSITFANSNMQIAALLMWERVVTAQEVYELTENPWQLFEPDLHRSLHFFTAAGGGVTVEPGKAELALTGYAPTVTVSTSDLTVAPDKADLSLTGHAPTVSVTENHLALPGKADLSLTGHAPTVAVTEHQTVAPGAADLSLTGFAPTVSVSENTTVTPDVAALALTGYAPSISVTQNHLALPGKADLALTAYAPTVTKTEHVIVNPTTGALVITGYAPTVTEQSQSPVISPAAAALILQTYAPTAVNSGDVAADVGQTPAGGRGRGRRRRLYVLEFRGEEFFFESLDDIRDFLAQQIEEQQPKVRRRGRPKKVVLEVPSLTFDGMEIGDLKVGKFSLAQALQERRKVPINDIRSAIERMIDDDDEEAAIAVL